MSRSGTSLSTLPVVIVPISAHLTSQGNTRKVTARVSNPTSSVALAIRLKVLRAPSDERVLPAMYEDNYFSLLPGESRTVNVSFKAAALKDKTPRLMVEGWNIKQESHGL